MPMDGNMNSIYGRDALASEQLVILVMLHFTLMLIRRDELIQAFRASGAYFH